MRPHLYILIGIIFQVFVCSNGQINITDNKEQIDTIVKIEMSLSAFGVESDDFPSIDVVIDFSEDSSYCKKWFYNPAIKDTTYNLTKKEMHHIITLLTISDLKKLKKEYKVEKTDQPRSKTIISTTTTKFVINDYGLEGEYPLKELYKIVYKL